MISTAASSSSAPYVRSICSCAPAIAESAAATSKANARASGTTPDNGPTRIRTLRTETNSPKRGNYSHTASTRLIAIDNSCISIDSVQSTSNPVHVPVGIGKRFRRT